jgi:hypothetical protein
VASISGALTDPARAIAVMADRLSSSFGTESDANALNDFTTLVESGVASDILARNLAGAQAAISRISTTLNTQTEALARVTESLGAHFGSSVALINNEATARSNADGALATTISNVQAISDAGLAQGRIRMVAAANPGSAAAAIDMQVSVNNGGAYPNAGLRLEVFSNNTARVVVQAPQFIVSDPTLQFVPFAVANGQVILQGVTQFGSTLRSSANNNAGLPVWEFNPNTPYEIWRDNT